MIKYLNLSSIEEEKLNSLIKTNISIFSKYPKIIKKIKNCIINKDFSMNKRYSLLTKSYDFKKIHEILNGLIKDHLIKR